MVSMRGLLACTVTLALVFSTFSHAQVLPAIGLTAEVLEAQSDPTGTTVYGTPRTFSATIANFGTATSIEGNLTFFAGTVPICTTPLLPTSLVGTVVTLSDLNPTLQAEILNAIRVAPGSSILGPLTPVVDGLLTTVLNTLGIVTITVDNVAQVSALLETLGLGNLQIAAGVLATCTTATIPVGDYPGLTVAYADLTVDGETVSLRPILDIPLLSPTAQLSLGAFSVVKASTTVSAPNPAPTLPGASTPLTVTVANSDAPPSTLPPDGGTVTALLGGTPIGSGTLTSTSGTSATFTFDIVVPAGTPAGPQVITLTYSGTPNFEDATSGLNGSPAGPTISVLDLVTFTATPTPATPPAGSPVTVAGTATSASGTPPTGSVTLTVNGVTTGPFPLTPGATSSTFSGNLIAPVNPSNGTPYPVTVDYTPGSSAFAGPTPPYTFPLTVGPATGTVTTTVTPTNPAATAPITVNGTVSGTNGLPPVGSVDIKVDGTTVINVPVGPDGTFTGTFPAPGTPGTYTVTASYVPAPGNSIAPATSAPTTITVGPATATITQTVVPNPAAPGGPATVNGTVTTATGSPAGGNVTVTLNGQPIGTTTVGADGSFNIPFTAPTAPGTYVLLTTFTPAGASAPTASATTTFVVSAGGGGGQPTNITISFGNGNNGFAFPNCLGPLTITVNGSGTPPPTGNVTLQISGGKIGDTPVTIGTATFVNGVATFNLESLRVKKELLDNFITHLTSFKGKLTLADIRDYSLLPEGVFLLLPGDYTLTALYPGDSVYAAASGSAPFDVDPLCLLLALALRA